MRKSRSLRVVAATLTVALALLVACDSESRAPATGTADTEGTAGAATTTPGTEVGVGRTGTAVPDDTEVTTASPTPAEAEMTTPTPWPTPEGDGRVATARIIDGPVPLNLWLDRESLAYAQLESGVEVPIIGAKGIRERWPDGTWLHTLGGGWLYYDPERIELDVRVQALPNPSTVEPLHAIGTRTGNDVVDALISAVERGDTEWIIEHLHYADAGEHEGTFLVSYDQGQNLEPDEAEAWARERFALGDVEAGDGLQVFGVVDFGSERVVTSGTPIVARYHVVVLSPNNSRWGMGIYVRADGQIVWVQHRGSAAYELDRSRRFVAESGYLVPPRPPAFLAPLSP